jgi:hypothetical protein
LGEVFDLSTLADAEVKKELTLVSEGEVSAALITAIIDTVAVFSMLMAEEPQPLAREPAVRRLRQPRNGSQRKWPKKPESGRFARL